MVLIFVGEKVCVEITEGDDRNVEDEDDREEEACQKGGSGSLVQGIHSNSPPKRLRHAAASQKVYGVHRYWTHASVTSSVRQTTKGNRGTNT